MREFRSDTIIKATPGKIWNVLMDFDRYSEWNPIITNIGREKIVNNKLNIMIDIPGQKRISTRLKITQFDPENEIHLTGRFLFPGLLDSHYAFKLNQLDDLHTKFIQEAHFSGLLTSAFFTKSAAIVNNELKIMNWALKHEAESKLVSSNSYRAE